MGRLQLAVLAIWLFPTFAIASATVGQTPPITSKTTLARYQHDTPQGTSPLDDLSPGGRKRFLAGLQFYPHGVGVNYGAPNEELTNPQIVRLFALFGEQELAKGLGLTPAQKLRFDHEREEDAKARGCTVQTCPESPLELRYDELITTDEDLSLPDARRFAATGRLYDRLFVAYQTSTAQRTLSRPDLRLLTHAVTLALFGLPTDARIAQLQADLHQMQQRGMIGDTDYADLHHALVTRRRFAEAATLVHAHPGMEADAIPELVRQIPSVQGRPTALSVDAPGRRMRREAFDLSGPLRIVVIAGCHFSEDAARAIDADPQLRPLFAKHAVWLTSPGESLTQVPEWNRKFPDQPLHVAWQYSDWPMIDRWSMPNYYVFRDGRLVKSFQGWKDLANLKQSLREAGAVH
ncbi:hypothetical protein ACPPVV_14170 [Rhodanobacter sp. Col0626]|uniref:hypothetical protein n=1 Tax=Rhodanobacter sp. Col0626 TaxID=3415679 RepID=UPI003CEE04DA